MAILFLIFCIFRVCSSCSAHVKTKSKVKILEDYVVSANFDRNTALPQLSFNGRPPITAELLRSEERILHGDGKSSMQQGRLSYHGKPEAQVTFDNDRGEGQDLEIYLPDKHEGNVLSERDLVGPPAAAVLNNHSLYAIGFITFLILLSSLQASLTLMTKSPGLLGSITKPLGRKRRFANFEEYIGAKRPCFKK